MTGGMGGIDGMGGAARGLIVAVDFDGTCVEDRFPRVGADIGAAPVLGRLAAGGARIILHTMRSDLRSPVSDEPGIVTSGGDYLSDALAWFESRGIPLWGVNSNPEQSGWTSSPKPFAHVYVDDRALGCPLVAAPGGGAFADWGRIALALLPAAGLAGEAEDAAAEARAEAGAALGSR